MKTYIFKVVIEQDEDFDGHPSGWHVYCPTLEARGGSTWGKTKEEALANIREVLEMIVEEMNEEGEQVPTDPDGDIQILTDSPVAIAQ